MIYGGKNLTDHIVPVIGFASIPVFPLIFKADVRAGMGMDRRNSDVFHWHRIFGGQYLPHIGGNGFFQTAQIQGDPDKRYTVDF